MDFQLSEEQRAFRDMARDFTSGEIAPHAAAWDEACSFPVEALRKAAALGLAGIYVRDDVGGSQLSRLDAAIVLEELAAGCASTAAYISIHNMACWMIDRFGADDLRIEEPSAFVAVAAAVQRRYRARVTKISDQVPGYEPASSDDWSWS